MSAGDYIGETPIPHERVESPTMMSQRTLLTVFLVVGLLIATAIGVLLYLAVHLGTLQHQSDADRDAQVRQNEKNLALSRENGYKNRSVACTALVAQSGPKVLPLVCLDPKVLRYYDPNKVPVAR